ncbi:MAG: mannose-1-phosphate guanylyltransferase/mannose-6-phosphate isomerase [Abitibacteriaceae bacterium]|nr:mannose-1-phosphate guanylyltransferase/mannose-6-phosphate isomerase [Abditibacteriaceae bacterium]
MLFPVILSGGSGSRLWPISRSSLPKQLLPLTSERSLLQETLLRLEGLKDSGKPVIVCNQEQRFVVAQQLQEINIAAPTIMLEPAGRNTAPAVAAVALHLLNQEDDALMLVLPADHVIRDIAAYHAAIQKARRLAHDGYLVTFGIVPDAPETGYGYIQRGQPLEENSSDTVDETQISGLTGYKVERFVEKPDSATAQKYVQSRDFWWNSGMFLLSAKTYLEELERLHPEVVAACREAVQQAYHDLDFYRLAEKAFVTCPSISIDYAVMEKTVKAAVIPVNMGWSDLGSWSSLWEFHEKDEAGNVTQGEVILHETTNCYVHAERRLVAAVGVEDLVVVETADAVLVVHKDHTQDVKVVVERLKSQGRSEHETHRRVYRPWGSYEGMDRGERFQVKRITVNPGAKLSLQMHHHRSEHWVVVSGTAEVTIGDKVHLVAENESVYVPLGTSHRLHNPGRIPLHLIEVQSGPYLGEDDIVRAEDIYGRLQTG